MGWPLVGDAVLPLSMVDAWGESIDEVVRGGSKLLVEDSVRGGRGGVFVDTECDAQEMKFQRMHEMNGDDM